MTSGATPSTGKACCKVSAARSHWRARPWAPMPALHVTKSTPTPSACASSQTPAALCHLPLFSHAATAAFCATRAARSLARRMSRSSLNAQSGCWSQALSVATRLTAVGATRSMPIRRSRRSARSQRRDSPPLQEPITALKATASGRMPRSRISTRKRMACGQTPPLAAHPAAALYVIALASSRAPSRSRRMCEANSKRPQRLPALMTAL
mmetsp:Transcript_95511/g.270133  ORF Transcript_95511/g.270133 Transcript_95511/m.270133 type:complete len:210 (+) Transcript_95511:348-977(+)